MTTYDIFTTCDDVQPGKTNFFLYNDSHSYLFQGTPLLMCRFKDIPGELKVSPINGFRIEDGGLSIHIRLQ